ncbi:MAG: glycogen synthase GlgA [Clostridiales bacterium]|jgi:starch synthase|nr:glycogen synthase GlgA [Clostridiales bacterium]
MKVLFVTTELYPFIKTGGLADVSYSLPKALHELGVDVRIIIPKYSGISQDYTNKMSLLSSFGVPVGWRNQYCGLQYLNYEGIPVYFTDNEYYFKRDGCYGYFDDGERFAFFSRAVMESVKYMDDDFIPDVIHCNDWHTAVIPLFLKDIYYSDPLFENTRTIFTIHNLKYQGNFGANVLEELLSLNMGYYNEDKLKFRDGISFMKAGIVYSDVITTVSETYASEIQTPFYGEGLDGLLREKSWKLRGILNGIDFKMYNPATDTAIARKYSSKSIKRKPENKAALQRKMNLPVNEDVPIIGIVSRLVRQKGFDLVTCVMEDILKMNLQLVVLGSGDTDYQDFFEYYASAYPGKISVYIGFDDTLSREIYAGADMFLMPSLFEPCGIGQMIAMRYGTVPIVRETGGLKDTVIPYNEFTGDGRGFSFANFNAHEMLEVIRYALVQFENKEAWNKIMLTDMACNFNWSKQAKKYLDIYTKE